MSITTPVTVVPDAPRAPLRPSLPVGDDRRLTGLDRIVHRLGASLVAWSEAHAVDRPSMRELARRDRIRQQAFARRDDDRAYALDRALFTRIR